MSWLRFVLVYSVIASPLLWAQSGANSDSVLTVQGSAEVRVVPDLAVVRLGVVEQAPTAGDAQDGVNGVANRIITALQTSGIEDSAVQTSGLTLSPVYSRQRPDAGQAPTIMAYRAANTITVRVEALERIGAVIDAALRAGANQLEGVSFELQDDLASRQAALRNAVGEAREKAQAIADALGVALVSILSVNEGGPTMERPMMEMSRAMSLQQEVPTPISPGELSVGASVTIQYRIEGD